MASTKVSQTSTSRKGEVVVLARQNEVRSPQHPGPAWLAPPCQEGTGDLRLPSLGPAVRGWGLGDAGKPSPKAPLPLDSPPQKVSDFRFPRGCRASV